MADLKPIPLCHCGKPSTHYVVGENGEAWGYFCQLCGRRWLAKLQRSEEKRKGSGPPAPRRVRDDQIRAAGALLSSGHGVVEGDNGLP